MYLYTIERESDDYDSQIFQVVELLFVRLGLFGRISVAVGDTYEFSCLLHVDLEKRLKDFE